MSSPGLAAAMTFTCIESSRYGLIARWFDNDRRRLIEALDVAQAPPSEACRAVLATGKTMAGDPERLAAVIIENRGWLDTLYLDSGGGKVTPASLTALLVRSFWLNTAVVPPGGHFTYSQSVLGLRREGSDDRGPDAFAHGGTENATQTTPRPRCASACTFLLAAGASRTGVAQVHRCSGKGSTIQEISEKTDRCLTNNLRHLYEKLGTGDAFIQAALSTTQATTRPVTMPRFAPTVEDALLQRCKSDLAQLDDLAALMSYDRRSDAALRDIEATADLAGAAKRVAEKRRATEACVRKIHERDRLTAFARHCGRGCTVRSLVEAVEPQLQDLRK